MLQLTEITELVIGDATDYSNGENDERHIFIFNANDADNPDTSFTAIIFAENPEEISIFSKNEVDSLKITLDIRNAINTFYDTDGKIIGYFDEKELAILNEKKEKLMEFNSEEMAFIDMDEVPYALVNDEIENELTEKYFSLPHMTIELIDPEENNLFRNLVLASLITLTL
jgi:hypothetical protein